VRKRHVGQQRDRDDERNDRNRIPYRSGEGSGTEVEAAAITEIE